MELKGSKTEKNIMEAFVNEELSENTNMYSEFAKEASEEGFSEIASLFMAVDKVENNEKENVWICQNCGHVYVGENAPEMCPTCNYPSSYFEIKANIQ